MESYSILMTIYAKDNPEHAKLAIDSMLAQTIKTNDFVLVCDGPLNSNLDDLIRQYNENNPNIFNVVRLEQNVGLGKALQIGLTHCKNELIARMDDDDVAVDSRCENQLSLFSQKPNISIVGSYMDEFQDDYTQPIRTKTVPCEMKGIKKYSRRRNPFNHSTVMFKKKAILAVGNYSDMRTNQDVELWMRLINNGYVGYNIPESLVLFRFDEKTYKRRKEWKNIKLLINIWKDFKKNKYCSTSDYLFVYWSQIAIFLMPSFILKWLYNRNRKNIE